MGAALVANYAYLQRKQPGCAETQCTLMRDVLRWIAMAAVLLVGVELVVLPFAAQHFLASEPMVAGAWMGLAGMAGNYAGSQLALKKGVWVIRPMLLLICGSLLLKIVWDMLK